MTKNPNEKELNEKNPKNTEGPVDGDTLNSDLQSAISDYWKEKQAPGFTGYKTTNREEGIEEAVRLDAEKEKESRHTRTPSNERERIKKAKPKKRRGKAFRVIRAILVILLLMILAGGGTVYYMMNHGEKAAKASNDSDEKITSVEEAVVENAGKTVNYKGVTYTLNENLSSILFIGVDREEYNESGEYGEGGQADTIFLATVDHETGETKMIPISRNSMVEIDEYNDDGTYWRQNQIQLALAYTYGDGKEESCKNVAKAVSRMLFGMPVNKYVTIDLSCIKTLNDAIGGVQVEVLDDLTMSDPELEQGAVVTLHGDQAESYVRYRETVIKDGADDTDNNAARMERQKQYLASFMKKTLEGMKDNPMLPLNLYNSVKDDMITDITPSEIVYYASLIGKKGLNNSILSIPGEVKHGEYTELYVDKDALYEIVLNTFYTRE